MKKIFFIFAILLSFIFITSPQAGTKEDIDQLRLELETLKNNNINLANTINAINQIQQDITLIKGQMESAGMNKVEKDSTYKELENRILSLETKVSQLTHLFNDFKKTYTPPPAGGTAPSTSANNPTQEYNDLLASMGQGNYREAISGFLGYMQKYPTSLLSKDAQYWIGEGYFSMSDFAKAISEFQKFVEQNPSHLKTKTAIYRQGVAFMQLKSYPEAKLFFQKVIGSFPTSGEALDAKKRIVRIDQLLTQTPPQAPKQNS